MLFFVGENKRTCVCMAKWHYWVKERKTEIEKERKKERSKERSKDRKRLREREKRQNDTIEWMPSVFYV